MVISNKADKSPYVRNILIILRQKNIIFFDINVETRQSMNVFNYKRGYEYFQSKTNSLFTLPYI